MAIINDDIVIDMIPIFENDDAKKVYDTGVIKFNQLILGIFNQLQMPKGTLTDYPDIGCMDSLLKLYFTETQETALAEIKENLSKYRRDQVNIDIVRDEFDEQNINISVSVQNIPNFKFSADLVKDNNYVKIINPKMLEV